MPTDSKLSVPPGPSPRLLLSSSDAISSSSVCVCVSRNPCRKGCRGQERVRQVLGKGQQEKIMWSAEQRYSPVTEVFKVEGERERRLVIGYKMGGTTTLSTLSNLFHFYSLFTKTWNSSSNAPTVSLSTPCT
ncbi:hypothetical protein BT96DRAFT_682094 [Gymnopus androsaceus JB14]|uniref:NAD-specific glutamate dehydrogenase second domain-containing protein n=1 Tax=Gymnopus androsaceus JB14 TaxID=1447944 RepID=A0A6A4GFG3_9AGAR|nr:hypothetical protein BT96DRAFT_682094 [Gymnopus androsaceus JB14]